MEHELRRYLVAIIVLLGLVNGYLATMLLVSALGTTLLFLVVPPPAVAIVAIGVACTVAINLPGADQHRESLADRS